MTGWLSEIDGPGAHNRQLARRDREGRWHPLQCPAPGCGSRRACARGL